MVHGYPARDPRAPGMLLVRATIVDTAGQLQARDDAHRAAWEARAEAAKAAEDAEASRHLRTNASEHLARRGRRGGARGAGLRNAEPLNF